MKKTFMVKINCWERSRKLEITEKKVILDIVVHCSECSICKSRIQYVKTFLIPTKGELHTNKYGYSWVEVPLKEGDDPIKALNEALPGLSIRYVNNDE